MRDLLYLALLVGLVALMMSFVVFCDHLVGSNRTPQRNQRTYAGDLGARRPDEQEEVLA